MGPPFLKFQIVLESPYMMILHNLKKIIDGLCPQVYRGKTFQLSKTVHILEIGSAVTKRIFTFFKR